MRCWQPFGRCQQVRVCLSSQAASGASLGAIQATHPPHSLVARQANRCAQAQAEPAAGGPQVTREVPLEPERARQVDVPQARAPSPSPPSQRHPTASYRAHAFLWTTGARDHAPPPWSLERGFAETAACRAHTPAQRPVRTTPSAESARARDYRRPFPEVQSSKRPHPCDHATRRSHELISRAFHRPFQRLERRRLRRGCPVGSLS